jgi:hypothetical protein
MDPKRPKIQSSWIQMKTTPSRSARRADSDSIFFSKMDSVWRSYRDLKFFPNSKKSKSKSRSKSTMMTEDDVSIVMMKST